MEKLSLDKNNLKKFGLTVGLISLGITVLFIIRHKSNMFVMPVIALIFLGLGYFAPEILRPVYTFWMKLAFFLGWVNTRIILIVFFYLIFAPIGLIIKIFGVDLLDTRIEKDRQTYWRKKDKKGFSLSNYERQF